MPRRATPEAAAKNSSKAVKRVRRQYKVNLKKRKKYMPGEEEFLFDMVMVLTLAGYSRTQMARAIGISKGQVKELLENPQVSEKIEKLKNGLPEAALSLIQGLMIEAVMAIADVMRTTDRDEMVLKAAGDILDRGGAAKASRTEVNAHTTNENRTTFDAASMVDEIRKLPPEKQEEAAQMIENVEKFLNVEAEKAMKKEPDGENLD